MLEWLVNCYLIEVGLDHLRFKCIISLLGWNFIASVGLNRDMGNLRCGRLPPFSLQQNKSMMKALGKHLGVDYLFFLGAAHFN